jgi:hypothetical protein
MIDDLVVIVGVGQGGQDEIIKALTKAEINSARALIEWPRDEYVYFNGHYFRHNRREVPDYFDVGGLIRAGRDFLIISEKIIESFLDKPALKWKRKAELIIERASKYYSNSRVYVAPEGWASEGHIDLFCLLCPGSKLLVLDPFHRPDLGFEELKSADYTVFEQIAEKEGLKLIKYNSCQDRVFYGMNACVLPGSDNSDIVVLDKKSKGLIKILNDHGVKTIGVNMPKIPISKIEGKINCQTNIYFQSDFVDVTPPLWDYITEFSNGPAHSHK